MHTKEYAAIQKKGPKRDEKIGSPKKQRRTTETIPIWTVNKL